MSGSSSFNLAGKLNIASGGRVVPHALSQVIGELEAKTYEVTIPAGGAWTTVPLPLSDGVEEVLVLYMRSPKKLLVRMTSNNVTTPGPMTCGFKGTWLQTFSPGEGIVTISASNPSAIDNVTLEIAIGAKALPTDEDPSYWQD